VHRSTFRPTTSTSPDGTQPPLASMIANACCNPATAASVHFGSTAVCVSSALRSQESSALVSLSAARCFAKAHLSAADSAACAGIASEAVSSAAAMATIDANLAIELFVEMDLMTFPFINFDRSTISNGHRRNGAIRSAKELERVLGADTLRTVTAR